eukprot:NODE_7441_length_1578_cov_3.649897.p1 GENE.NODE_7441_length_1578_cov_3.649897~~NODE_7441_length_1578_cov_3.649897.p1  ORF type:complete len:442 (-),score=152.76 NODE_7441_length_1578_cov_3.649897:193-1518(-)
MLSAPAGEFAAALRAAGKRRAWAIWDQHNSRVRVSHPGLRELQSFLENDKVDYSKHEALFFELGKRTGAMMGAFVWKTCRGQGCGGVRLRSYESIEEYVRDGMRLAIGMGRKSALAGLWAGGAKGVIVQPPGNAHEDPAFRHELFRDYGEFLTSLRGCYVAAEDAGLNVEDCDVIFSKTRFMTCISPALGGSGNPSVPTAAGVVSAMEGAASFLDGGDGSLEGLTVAVQGTGNVGAPLMRNLFNCNVAKVIASDVSAARLSNVEGLFASEVAAGRLELQQATPGDCSILATKCDIVAPCGFGAVLNDETIPTLRCRIVCGAANNQLADPADGDVAIAERGITYVPDFVANRMGIVNCANETYGRVGDEDPAIMRHLGRDWENSVFSITRTVLERAAADGITPGQAGNRLADDYASQLHPIWGHRSQAIIDSLLRDGWVDAI